MLSIIIQEHNEGEVFVHRMIDQVKDLHINKELIFVTSLPIPEFYSKYNLNKFLRWFPISVIGNVNSCGAARNAGGRLASGDTFLFMDCHVCFTPRSVDTLLTTLDRNPKALVGPALRSIEFPECTFSGAQGHGVAFRFADNPFEWVWLPAETTDREFEVPFICGCTFSMKKDTFNVLNTHGGFLASHEGLSFEEEKSMRMWRLGHPSVVEPRAVFGHLFKGYADHPTWDEHSTRGYHKGRVAGFFVNVFNKDLWNHIEKMLINKWGDDYFRGLNDARKDFGWLRNQMARYKNVIDENWFLRTR